TRRATGAATGPAGGGRRGGGDVGRVDRRARAGRGRARRGRDRGGLVGSDRGDHAPPPGAPQHPSRRPGAHRMKSAHLSLAAAAAIVAGLAAAGAGANAAAPPEVTTATLEWGISAELQAAPPAG